MTVWRRVLGIGIVSLLLSFSVSAPAALSPLRLQDPLEIIALPPHMEMWCDGSGESELAAALVAEYGEIKGNQITLGYRSDACWFRAELINASASNLPLWLLVDYALLDEVDLYLIGDSGVESWRLGDKQSFSSRPVPIRIYTVPLILKAGDEKSLYMRVKTTSSMTVPLSLSGGNNFVEYYINNDWLIGVFYGIGLGLFFYHLVLWLNAREKVSRFYVVHVGAATLYIACLQGVAQRFWFEGVLFPDDTPYLSAYIALAAAALFTRDYLHTQRWQRIDRTLLALAGLCSIAIVIQLLAPSGSVNSIQPLIALLAMAIMMATGVYGWLKGIREARIFVLAWAVFLGMTTLFAFNVYGLIDLPSTLSVHGIQIGMVLQQVLLAFGLAARLSALKDEALSRQEEISRAQAESAAKSDFLAKMSHEIRTPMNAVLGLADLMRSTNLDPTQRNYVETIYSAGGSLLSVINDILDYSKITSGKIDLDLSTFDLESLLEDCLTIFHANAEKKGLRLVSDWGDSLPQWVEGDPTRVRQILLNLISNAVKFTDHGEVALFARASAPDDQGYFTLRCEVRDQGIGMTADQLGYLFQSFQQADSSTSRKYGGTGLGLAISRQLAEIMHGSVEATSELGKGTVFKISLQLRCSKKVAPEPRQMKDNSLAGLRVLVVEDNAVNQMVIWALLKKLDITVTMISNGEEALERVTHQHHTFDLVLMDCEMPNMDGYETAQMIREWEETAKTNRIAIVALTAHALSDHRERCIASGMDDHISKPVTLKQLREKLLYWAPVDNGKSTEDQGDDTAPSA